MEAFLTPLAALAIGMLLGWLFGRRGAGESAVLAERVAQREQTIADERREREELEREFDALRARLEAVATERAKLETQVKLEREATAEKLALVSETEKRLVETFKALSSDALRCNNESFLNLAKERFERIQEAAKGDLEKRQLAINE
ncbi:MAG: hypothetical protein KDD44_12005, partial [Bdellovibrionales bacterium]|nr:hypothetical protein [Bdellovibrionales bacterium]